MADALQQADPYYFQFWTAPGHVGYDQPELVNDDLIDMDSTVTRILTAQDFRDDPSLQGAQYRLIGKQAMTLAGTRGFDLPIALEIAGASAGYQLGANIQVTSGKAAGRSLYVMFSAGDLMVCDGAGENSNLRFTDVEPGDAVHFSNRAFLAHCYYSRHHLTDEPKWDFMRVDSKPIYPQHDLPLQSPFMGVAYTGQYEGKLMWVHHTHDASLWPPEGIIYGPQVQRSQGQDAAAGKFRLRWTENAEHVPPDLVPSMPNRKSNTWLIDYMPIIEQSLVDLAAWIEQGIEPPGTNFDFRDGKVILPPTAKERRGIQPVVHVTANGGVRAEVRAGQPVTLAVHAETPPGAGGIIAVAWDVDGSGKYPLVHDGLDGSASAVDLTRTHSWNTPGTYFATCLVHSHVNGDPSASSRRLPNLASARVIVT